jgi:hypothetical protein
VEVLYITISAEAEMGQAKDGTASDYLPKKRTSAKNCTTSNDLRPSHIQSSEKG